MEKIEKQEQKNIQCECGFVNPIGTVLCEVCGNPLVEQSTEILDMRYGGAARRSETYTTTTIDRIWNFFSSVKIGVSIIVVMLVASAVGTIYPQQMYIPPTADPSVYYETEYGALGKIYYTLGLHNTYTSWWYTIIIGLLCVSIIIASIDRAIPLYRSLKNQGVTRHDRFMQRQRLFGETKLANLEQSMEILKINLKKRHYKVYEEQGNIFAEKNRFSRWGAYVNHTGLIIFFIGVMIRMIPGVVIDEPMWIREGETRVIPGTNDKYYLKNEKFIFEVYDKEKEKEVYTEALDRVGNKMVAKNYQTNVILYENVAPVTGADEQLKEIKKFSVRVNEPLEYNQYSLYQVDFKQNELSKMSFQLIDKKSKKQLGTVPIELDNPQTTYNLGNGNKVEILSYFPDFFFEESGGPATKSKIPNNPAFVFKMITKENPKGEVSFVGIQQTVEPEGVNKYKMEFVSAETRNVSALMVHRDLSLWVLAVGGTIFMIGVIQGLYWNYRRMWFKRNGETLLVASYVNKNWYGMKKEIETVLNGTSIPMPADKLENKKGGMTDGTIER